MKCGEVWVLILRQDVTSALLFGMTVDRRDEMMSIWNYDEGGCMKEKPPVGRASRDIGSNGVFGSLPCGPARYKICSLHFNAMMRTFCAVTIRIPPFDCPPRLVTTDCEMLTCGPI